MATATNNKSAPASAKPVKLPPEPEFWKRYSPHYELPVSAASSFFLHVLGVGLIFGLALVLFKLIPEDAPVPVGGVAIGGGGGALNGVDNGHDTGPVQSSQEATQDGKSPDPVTNPTESTTLDKPEVTPPKLSNDRDGRFFNAADAKLGSQELANLGMKVSARLRLHAKGQGGPGTGGGEGGGVGTGKGPGKGPGTGNLNIREQRRNRWVMIFNTRSGQDYANQLAGLGAIIGVQGSDGQYTLYRDLNRRPVTGKVEDPNELNRIFWEDSKRESVTSLATALGIRPIPDSIVAFFPEKLEEELLKIELKAYGSDREQEISETYFRVERQHGKYVPVVSYQQRK